MRLQVYKEVATIDIKDRVTVLEGDVKNNQKDISEIKKDMNKMATKEDVEGVECDVKEIEDKMDQMATKDDVKSLKKLLLQRDNQYTKNMWRVIFGLLGIVGTISLTAFGIEKIPTLF